MVSTNPTAPVSPSAPVPVTNRYASNTLQA